MNSLLWKTLKMIALVVATTGCVGSVGSPEAGGDGQPPADTEVGKPCGADADCSGDARCLRFGEEQYCVLPCVGDVSCPVGQVCNPVHGSSVGWCEYPAGSPSAGAPAPPGGETPSAAPPPEPDPALGPAPEPRGGDNNTGGGAEPPPDGPEASSTMGGSCACDSDCADFGGHRAICVHGVCMVEGSSMCSRSGSTAECPAGSRCWSGTGVAVCYPDCDSVTCSGQCDSDGSCVRSGDNDCYRSCGTVCGWAGNPPGTGTDDPDPVEPDDPDPDNVGPCGTPVESRQFDLVNADRQRFGLPPLECHTGLVEVAGAHSRDMADRNFFSHTNPNGESPWDRMERHGITNYRTAGENIAWGQRTPEEVQQTWMNSPGHRANILSNSYTHIGVGVYDGPDGIYWTQVFAAF